MKKQFLILATTITTVALISCSKETIEAPETTKPEAEIMTKKGNPPSVNLNKGLDGWYRFDGNLIESTGQFLPAGTGPVSGADVYTEDRNGLANRAIKFNGRYTLSIPGVPHANNMSLAAWVKYDSASAPAGDFVISQSDGPRFMQATDQYFGKRNFVAPSVTSGPINDKWHHLVVTIDGTFLKLYVDGNLIGSVLSPDNDPQTTEIYLIGHGNVLNNNWHGAMDDLRFYTRTLSANEVQALYNL